MGLIHSPRVIRFTLARNKKTLVVVVVTNNPHLTPELACVYIPYREDVHSRKVKDTEWKE
jgi:hypothetical protein